MKKFLVLICLLLPVLALHARGIQEDYRTAEERARASYAFGMVLGSNLSTISVDIDFDAFSDGVRAMIEGGNAQFSEREAMEIVESAIEKAMNRISAENMVLEELFMAQNRERPGVMVTESGLQYEILEEGTGNKPVSDSVVLVNYVGTFIDGSPFDSSSEGGLYLPLDRVIPGWTEGIMLMSEGSTFRLFVPSHLAYGKDGIPPVIPPYSALVFTVDLLEIVENEIDFDF